MTTYNLEELRRDRVVIEQRINQLIADFELKYKHDLEIENIEIRRMRLIGPHKAVVNTVVVVRSDTCTLE